MRSCARQCCCRSAQLDLVHVQTLGPPMTATCTPSADRCGDSRRRIWCRLPSLLVRIAAHDADCTLHSPPLLNLCGGVVLIGINRVLAHCSLDTDACKPHNRVHVRDDKCLLVPVAQASFNDRDAPACLLLRVKASPRFGALSSLQSSSRSIQLTATQASTSAPYQEALGSTHQH